MVASFYMIHDPKYQTKYGFDLEYTAQVYTYVYKHYGGQKAAYGPAKQVASAIRSPLKAALTAAVGSGEFDLRDVKPDVFGTAMNATVMAFGSVYYDFNLWWQQQTTGEVWANPYSPVSDTDAYVTYFLWSLKKGKGIYWTNSFHFSVALGTDYFDATNVSGIYFDPAVQAFA